MSTFKVKWGAVGEEVEIVIELRFKRTESKFEET